MSVQGLHVGTFSVIVLVALCSCRPVVGSSLLEWMGISSGSDTTGNEVTVQDGTPLLKVPFEEASPEDKFLREAEKLVGLKTSQLDTCQHKVVMKIQSSCASISEEELAKLSVNLLNCQSAVEGRQQFPCTEKMSLRDCTNKMDSDMWNTYHLMNNRARAVCYAARHQQFRALSEMTVNRLMRTANEQLQTMDLLRDGQTKLESLTSGTLESVSKGHQTLLAEQEKLRSTQQSVHDFVALNLRELTREKALIAAGQRELSLMTKEVKAKLDDASLQLSNHASEHQQNHLQVLADLENLQRKAFEIWDHVDHSTKQILSQHAEAADDLEKMLNNMAKINSSIEYLLKTVERTRSEIDERLGWIIKFITESGDQLEWMQQCVAHGLFLVLGMIATSFIQAPSAVRCALILLVPLNLALTSYEGADGALDFSGLTLLLILFSGVNWLLSSIHEWFIAQGNFSRLAPVSYAPLQNGTSLNGQVPTQGATEASNNLGFVDSCLLQLSSTYNISKNKISETSAKLSSVLQNLIGRRKEERTPVNVSIISNDEVDEGDNSDNEGSVEQEIRLSSRRLLPQARLYNTSVLRSDSPASSRSSRSFTPSRSGRNYCQRFTLNGNPCKKLALPDMDTCHTHSLSSPARG
ncbi:protein brambleberry [Frankliniella occidentalis]|uniref:Protein brambleberry n=1 Tax=Frankliniella occidentalis TaxID=133901 RepID=A0A6J1T0G0_FRAOC|nr:protein brambleberry [Frankliniella occidentalis]